MRLLARIVALACVCVITSSSRTAWAWSLKTHAWIAEQVLNEVLRDGHVELLNRKYRVPPRIVSALTNHPERFRMGSLGPDVFPDPIVGQTTTHPGVAGGWQAHDWLKHLLDSAKTDEELAFAFGFIAHAAGDVFAHTYVNAYAGDIFSLVDQERDVELRHFVLEKYIEGLTPQPIKRSGAPVNWKSDFGTATSFARDVFILHGRASRENLRAKTGGHLTAMYEVHRVAHNLEREAGAVTATLANWGAKYIELELKLLSQLPQARLLVEASVEALKKGEDLLRVRKAAVDAALRVLKEAHDIVDKHPELIFANEQLLLVQARLATEAAAEAARIADEVNRAIGDIQDRIRGIRDRLARIACDSWLLPKPLKELCKRLVGDISRLERQISLQDERRALSRRVAEEAAAVRDATSRLVAQLREELNNAARKINDGTYAAAIKAAEIEYAAQQRVVQTLKEALIAVRNELRALEAKIEDVAKFTRPIEDFIKKHDPIVALIGKWRRDIETATEEYIKASHEAGLLMLESTGNPLAIYKEWFDCYGQVFQAIPKEIGQAGCLTRQYIGEVLSAYDRLLSSLPEVIQWIVAPSRKIQQIAEKEMRGVVEKAGIAVIGFISDKRTAEFIELLIRPENATRAKLQEVFRNDDSGKDLIRFEDVAGLVDRDLKIHDGKLQPKEFAPLAHAVTLTKLAILEPAELQRLVDDVLGGRYGASGRKLFPDASGNFSLLIGMVRSLDGNHQWQPYGLPYPKREGVAHKLPHESHYGRDGFAEPGMGLVLWRDRFLRERVFGVLFPQPVIGVLTERSELSWPQYRFPSCGQNPFPATQNDSGTIVDADDTCRAVRFPDRPIDLTTPATPAEAQAKLFRCDNKHADFRWTILGPFTSKHRAILEVRRLERKYPDMYAEVWKPSTKTTYWPVVLAACVTPDEGAAMRDTALRRRLARRAVVNRAPLPWAGTVYRTPAMQLPELRVSKR